MNIKTFALACLFVATLALRTAAKDFTTKTTFNSVESFVAAMKDFSPSHSKGDIAALFEDDEQGAGELGARIKTAKFDVVKALTDEGASIGVVFVSAKPPTDRIPVEMGVLFLLTQDEKRWRITDLLRFVASGSEASVHAEESFFDHPGDGPQSHVVVTVTEWSGGRRRNRGVSESYGIENSRFVRVGLAPTRLDGKLLEPPVSSKIDSVPDAFLKTSEKAWTDILDKPVKAEFRMSQSIERGVRLPFSRNCGKFPNSKFRSARPADHHG